MQYFDCHADTLTEMHELDETLWENRRDVDLRRAQAFADSYTQIFAVWKNVQGIPPEEMDRVFWPLYQRAQGYLQAQADKIALCTTAQEMHRAHAQGKAAAFLSIEDVSCMGSFVNQIFKLGFRFAMLAWNYENPYACGAATDQKKGLTAAGKALAEDLLSQGVVLDISHLSDAGAADLFAMTDRPIMASHSDVRAVCGKPRNLAKWQIEELIRRRGLIGLNFFAPFVGEDPTAADLLRHADAVLALGGEDVLALGGDFDGCDGLFPKGIEGVQSIPQLWDLFCGAFGEAMAEKIFHQNAERFLEENLK